VDKKLHGQKNHPRITLITRKKAQAQRRAISAIKKSVLIRVIRGQKTPRTKKSSTNLPAGLTALGTSGGLH